MTCATLNTLLPDMPNGAIAGLVCLGWEEVQSFIAAAQEESLPIALMVGPAARAAMPLSIWGKMLRVAVEESKLPFAIHLDHGQNLDEVREALDCGFTSVMFDGSRLSLKENIATTSAVVKLATSYQASSEGEIGFVGYADGEHSNGTDIKEAQTFAQETDVDFMAVSVGNIHLQQTAIANPDWMLLKELSQIGTPLVIHGGSGFSPEERRRMMKEYGVCKFNIGTTLRMRFGAHLRQILADDKTIFDHLQIMQKLQTELVKDTRRILAEFKD